MSKIKEFIFLGTGTSGYVPNIHCLIRGKDAVCQVCQLAMEFDKKDSSNEQGIIVPKFNKNRRRNTSGLIRYQHSDGTIRNVLLDCGKSFYESALNWFVEYNLQKIEAVILTHGHADAMMGLDDLRQWTIGEQHACIQEFVDVYLNQETLDVVSHAFPYLIDTSNATGGGVVPKLKFHLIETGSNGPLPFTVGELGFIPFEVEHGVKAGNLPYYALGFRIDDISYVSDANLIPPRASDIMKDSKYLVIDALRPEPYISHFSYGQAIDECLIHLRQGGTGFFTGMTHARSHDDIEAFIKEDKRIENATIQVVTAYDGLRVAIS